MENIHSKESDATLPAGTYILHRDGVNIELNGEEAIFTACGQCGKFVWFELAEFCWMVTGGLNVCGAPTLCAECRTRESAARAQESGHQ